LNSRIDSIVAKEIKTNGPGLSIGIINKGKSMFCGYYGLMNLDYDLPVTENTTYNLAYSQLFIKVPTTF